MDEPGKPHSGLLVISIEQAVAAPICTMRLADAGARVIKVEPMGGETARHYDSAVKGHSAYFASLNRGKESVCLNLKSADDLELLCRMLTRADVFVRNTNPGAMGRLGLGADALVKTYPRLVTVDIVGYGQDTTYRNMKAYDLLVQAESGLCSVTGTPDDPCKVGVSVADMGTGLNAYSAILEGLIERSRTGRGKAVEISMFDSMAEWMSVPLLHFEHTGTITSRHGLAHASIYPYRAYSCTDGDVLIAVQNASQWTMFCTIVLGEPSLEKDTRFVTNAARVENREALDRIIEGCASALSVPEFVAQLETAGIAYARLRTVHELSQHPALHRHEVRVQSDSFSSIASPIAPPGRLPVKIPAIGEHTESVREEFLTTPAADRRTSPI